MFSQLEILGLHFSVSAKISVSVFQNRQGVVAQTPPGGSLEVYNKYLNRLCSPRVEVIPIFLKGMWVWVYNKLAHILP